MPPRPVVSRPSSVSAECLLSQHPISESTSFIWTDIGSELVAASDSIKIISTARTNHLHTRRSNAIDVNVSSVVQQLDTNKLTIYPHRVLLIKASAASFNIVLSFSPSCLQSLKRNNFRVFVEIWEFSDLFDQTDPEPVPGSTANAELMNLDPISVFAKLKLSGFEFDPSKITETLNMEPSNHWLKGSLNERSGRKYPGSAWMVSTESAQSRELDEHLSLLLAMLSGKRSALRKLIQCGVKAEFIVFYESSWYVSRTVISENSLAELSSLALPLNMDMYFPL